MKRTNRIFAIFLAVIMALGLSTPALALENSDEHVNIVAAPYATDADVNAIEDGGSAESDALPEEKIGGSEIDFTTDFPDHSYRAIRMAETNLGDFNADAYYWYMNEVAGLTTDIAIMNGGGIRFSVDAGDWSDSTCKSINPFGNTLCVIEVSGQTILDALEFGARYVGLIDETTGMGTEYGGFLQVAGLTYEIDASVENTVRTDDEGVWQSGPDVYRVGNVKVYNKAAGTYEALDLNKLYSVAGSNFTLLDYGDGFNMLSETEKISNDVVEDHLALAAYVKAFADSDGDGYADVASANSPLASYQGYLLNYEDPAGAGRITIIDGSGSAGSSDPADDSDAIDSSEPADSSDSADESTVETNQPSTAVYTVASGDSLWRIASKYYGSGTRWNVIYEANKDIIREPSRIYVGQTLIIPSL